MNSALYVRRRALALLGGLLALTLLLAGQVGSAEPLPSLVLIASERLDDPRFRKSVVLVTRHGGARSGAIGVIINRPLRMPLRQLFPNIPKAPDSGEAPALHYGGPISPQNLVYLFRTTQQVPADVLEVHPRVYLGQSPILLGRLLHRELSSEGLQVFAGYSGWAPGQLEAEIRRGDWLLLPVGDEILFPKAPQGLWKELHQRASQRRIVAPTSPGNTRPSPWGAPPRHL